MRKIFYCLILLIIVTPIINYGMTLGQEPTLTGGLPVLYVILPAFAFLLGNIFILMFDKEKKPLIIIATSLSISAIGALSTIAYFNITPVMLNQNQGILIIVITAFSICALSVFSLHCYAKAEARRKSGST